MADSGVIKFTYVFDVHSSKGLVDQLGALHMLLENYGANSMNVSNGI